MFNKVEDGIKHLENIQRKDKRENLNRISAVLEDFDNPHKKFKTIHVAGTNGKGSVCNILQKTLSTKYKVGLFTSPYIIKFNERIQVNNEYINDKELLDLINVVYDYSILYNSKNDDIIPFFELVFLISLLYFERKNIDIAIIEVGVGGLLDCTNVINSDVSLITNISLDHQSYLGNDVQSIAKHKLGIVKKNTRLYTTVDDSLKSMFIKHCENINVDYTFINKEKIVNIESSLLGNEFMYNNYLFKISLIGIHQVYNSSLVIEVLKDYFKFTYDEINQVLNDISFNGRLEIINKEPLILIDGAHNIDGITSLVNTIKTIFKKKVTFCFAAMRDKDINDMLSLIGEVSNNINITQINYYRSNIIEDYHDNNGINKFSNVESLLKHIDAVDKDEIIIFTGSLYFISEIRKYYK